MKIGLKVKRISYNGKSVGRDIRVEVGKDYNRYDTIIQEVTDYWNNEFANDTDPPPTLLDPNLVKAIVFQETRVGNDARNNGVVNIMQVGNRGDASLKTLRGDLPERWIHHGKQALLNYNAKVETVRDSVHWGVRWLYHKAQYIGFDGRRHWHSWKEAVHEYGPNTKAYSESGWNIYTKGAIITLWTITLFLLFTIPFGLQPDAADFIRETILSARFIALDGIDDPVLEVYGKTHVGHGRIYLYRVGDAQLSLLLSAPAVDSYNESVWRPGGYPEYGYTICGRVYKGDRLMADYSDENNDGISDAVLTGNVEVICEDLRKELRDEDDFDARDVHVAELPVHEIHFLDAR